MTKKDKESPVDTGGNEPDFRSFLQPVNVDEKARLIRDLITSDKNLRTKARIPDAFNASVMDLLGRWEKAGSLSGMITSWGNDWREDGISEEGGSRVEYTTAVIGFRAEPEEENDRSKVKEGNRK